MDSLTERVFHRQMYIDLTRAYLREYGTQRELARALGISPAAVNQFLRPLHVDEEEATTPETFRAAMRDELGISPTPSRRRAEQIVARLCTDVERREALLGHIAAARGRPAAHSERHRVTAREDLERELEQIGAVHNIALRAIYPEQTRFGYAEVWRASRALLPEIDGGAQPLLRVRALLYLHDAASVLNRADLALGYAREATLILEERRDHSRLEAYDGLRLNTLFAEVVTLNNLELRQQAVERARYALDLNAGEEARNLWHRALLEQTVKGLGSRGRIRVTEVEYAADAARERAGKSGAVTIGSDSYLVAAYLAHGTARSVRKAMGEMEALRATAESIQLVPLRRARLLRVAAAVYRRAGEPEEERAMIRQSLTLISAAGMKHQRAQLERLVG